MSNRIVRVKRVLIAAYDVPVDHYDGMTDAEIVAWERAVDDPAASLDNLTEEIVDVQIIDEEGSA